jgi:hypothetical protein
MLTAEKYRPWIVKWMYGVAIGHFIVGAFMPWIGSLSMFDAYHRFIESQFWTHDAEQAARAQQIWWISLFGPTVQSVGIWMGALIYFGNRYRSNIAWGWLIVGTVVWAPQDMLISLRANAWIHVWIDCFALATILPPLAWLWMHDRRNEEN